MVFLGGIEVFERADLHEEFFAAAALDLRVARLRLSRAVLGEVNAGLVLAAACVALPVLHRGVDDIEVGQQHRGEKQCQYASIHHVSSFQGNQDSLRPFERHGQCSGAQQALF